jgi:hypothetical protein
VAHEGGLDGGSKLIPGEWRLGAVWRRIGAGQHTLLLDAAACIDPRRDVRRSGGGGDSRRRRSGAGNLCGRARVGSSIYCSRQSCPPHSISHQSSLLPLPLKLSPEFSISRSSLYLINVSINGKNCVFSCSATVLSRFPVLDRLDGFKRPSNALPCCLPSRHV